MEVEPWCRRQQKQQQQQQEEEVLVVATVEEEAVEEEEEWRTGRTGTRPSASWMPWRAKSAKEQEHPEPSKTITPFSDEGKEVEEEEGDEEEEEECLCVSECERVSVRLDEAAYIIAIHNQYFYFVSKVEAELRRRGVKY